MTPGRTILFSSFAVFAGGIIYILFRPAEPAFFNWIRAAGIENQLSALRGKSLSISSWLPLWMVYSLPNGLWAFAYTFIVLRIWTGSRSVLKYVWILSIPLLVFGFELLQLSGTLPGTFDLNDMIWSAAGIILGCITVHIGNGRNGIKKNPGRHAFKPNHPVNHIENHRIT